MKRILIVGEKPSNLADYIKRETSYDYMTLKDTHSNKAFGNAREVVCDFSSKEATLAAIDSLALRFGAVIATPYENSILPTAWIVEHTGLPGIPVAAAKACTDEYIMRQLFAQSQKPISPDFAAVSGQDDLMRFANTHQFPLILKPTNLVKSLLVSKNHTLSELLDNYQQAINQLPKLYKRYAPHRTPQLIIEEFLEGSIHSVDAFVDIDGTPRVLDQVVDYQTGYDIGLEDNFHYSRIIPSRLSATDQDALRHCAARGVQALGMKSTPAHIEIIMTNEGPRIVEIGARNGGYRERMHRLANGIDIFKAHIALSFNQPFSITSSRHESCAVLELFPQTPGIFQGITNEIRLKKLPSLHYFAQKVDVGSFVDKASQGHKMCAIIILYNADRLQFQKDLEYVNQHVAVQTR